MKIISVLMILLLGACSTASFESKNYRTYIAVKGAGFHAPERFSHCHGYGCRIVSETSLHEEEQIMLASFFTENHSAVRERENIKNAVGWLEQTVGARLGTNGDVEGTYRKLGNGQHDCVDESVNTTIYLSILDQLGLLRFHATETPHARPPILGGGLGPHQTAVIMERETQQSFAVDSWFHDNGIAPEIVPMRDWFFGWKPSVQDSPNDRAK